MSSVQGKKPDALYKVKDPEVREFIEKCLANVSLRLSAKELLDDPFLRIDDDQLVSNETGFQKELDYVHSQPFVEIDHGGNTYRSGSSNDYSNDYTLDNQNEEALDSNDYEQSGIKLFDNKDYEDDEHPTNLNIIIKGKEREDGSIVLRLRILGKEGHVRNIYFPFDIEMDTALSVATEMVAELDIYDQDVTEIADMIDGEIASLVPEWKLGPGIEETPHFSDFSFSHNYGSSDTSTESFMNSSRNNLGTSSDLTQCVGNECTASRGRFEEITYQIDRSSHDPLNPADYASAPSSLSNGFHHPEIRGTCSSGDSCCLESCDKLDQEIPANDEQGKETSSITTKHFRSLSSSRSLIVASRLSNDSANLELIQEDLRWLEETYQEKLRELRDQELVSVPRSSKPPRSTASNTQKIRKGISSLRELIKSSVRRHSRSNSELLLDQERNNIFAPKRARKWRAKKVSANVKDFKNDTFPKSPLHRVSSLPINAIAISSLY